MVPRIKHLFVLLGLLAPALNLAYLTLRPQADLTLSVPIFHFYIVTFTTFTAAVISLLLVISLGPAAHPRHLLAATAFAVIGGTFFSHGLATPNALIDHAHPAVEWSAWLTLLGGATLFALAGVSGLGNLPRWLPVRAIIRLSVGSVLLYTAVAALAPQWLTWLDRQAGPWHRQALFALTFGLWTFAAWRLWQGWRATRSRVDGVLVFVALWLATATISMHLFPVWNVSWWLYHVVLLLAFLITASVLAAEYEQVRYFRLGRYYLATSLILTALLALVASALFTSFSYTTLVSEVEVSAANIAENVANSLMSDLPEVVTAADLRLLASRPGLRALLDLRTTSLPINSLHLYDTDGVAVYAREPEWIGVRVENPTAFRAALHGQTQVMIRPPDDRPASYHPSSQVYIVESHTPIRASRDPSSPPIGVLVTIQEAPQLNQATLRARLTGLVTAAITMGLLFAALLSVVRRADQILSTRSEELAAAYGEQRKLTARLKTYSEWLLGRTLLGQALANPDALSLARQERTILFIDIRSFTRWSETRLPEEVVDMLNHYYNCIEAVLIEHEVIKFKFAADEAMAVFAEAHQAVAAARTLQIEVGELLGDKALGAGIGLHTGMVVEGLLGSKEVKFYDVIGDTVNTAKRIESAAADAEVLLSEATLHALNHEFTPGPARQIAAKGKEAPLTVYPLVPTLQASAPPTGR